MGTARGRGDGPKVARMPRRPARKTARRGAREPTMSDWPKAMTRAVLAEAEQRTEPAAARPGDRPWDDWCKRAIAACVSAELAALGRAVMREAHVSGWQEDARIACGWLDDGQAMIALALANPARAEQTWSRLLETQGALGAAQLRRA
jgi:hypothetical protein